MEPPTTGNPTFSFPATSWTLVVRAWDRSDAAAKEQLERLCRAYWKPVYGQIRRRFGLPHEDSADLTQEFFAEVLATRALARADRSLGRFRTFLRAALENFVLNRMRSQRAIRRGGGVRALPLEALDAEPAVAAVGSEEFDGMFAAALLEDAVKLARERFVAEGDGRIDRVFEMYYLGATQPTYEEIARRLALTPHQVERALKSARNALRAIVRARLRETLSNPADLDEEMRTLFPALAQGGDR